MLVFERCHALLSGISGRITAANFQEQVLAPFHVPVAIIHMTHDQNLEERMEAYAHMGTRTQTPKKTQNSCHSHTRNY